MYLFRNELLSSTNIVVSLRGVKGMSWANAEIITAKSAISFSASIVCINEYAFYVAHALLRRTVISQVRMSRRLQMRINRLVEMKSYKGVRHSLCLPVRGQRTRTNAKTQKAKRFIIKKRLVK